jgi:two-component system response regulator protein BraR/BceR
MYKILIVEDDPAIAALLEGGLKVCGLKQPYRPHPVLPDLSLLFYSGYYRCNEIRKLSKVPVVFLSAYTENMDIIVAMNMGADDYVAEPFSLELVVAKLQARLRRSYLNILTIP